MSDGSDNTFKFRSDPKLIVAMPTKCVRDIYATRFTARPKHCLKNRIEITADHLNAVHQHDL